MKLTEKWMDNMSYLGREGFNLIEKVGELLAVAGIIVVMLAWLMFY